MNRLILALLAVALAGCARSRPATSDEDAPARGSEVAAFALERGVERVAAQAGPDALWPGFDPLAVPLAVYDGYRTYLFRHPNPPEGFAPVSGEPGVFAYDGRHEGVIANTSAEIGGVPTATVMLGSASGPPADLAPLAVHEAFHVFQRERHPAWAANEADLFVYPTDDPAALALRRLETDALRRALAAGDAAGTACWSRRALALRAERYGRLDSASVAYERGTELNEGLAAYVEARAADRTTLDFPPGGYGPADVRRRAYATGTALALLLDRAAPDWRRAFDADDDQPLDAALGQALGAGEACAFGAAETAGAERRARADVDALAAERAERLAAFEGRPGWRVVVEAAGHLLWPQGFDPLNVERVGPARILHARFLRLGNDLGHLEALDGTADVEVLTEGAGPHPLFNGVARVVLTGLQEPEVSEAGGAVEVSAPGFTATFEGAQIIRGGNTIIVQLGP